MEPLEQPFIYIALESGSLVDSEGDKRKGAVGMVKPKTGVSERSGCDST